MPDKDILGRPIIVTHRKYSKAFCPGCGVHISVRIRDKRGCCPTCNQKIDWDNPVNDKLSNFGIYSAHERHESFKGRRYDGEKRRREKREAANRSS